MDKFMMAAIGEAKRGLSEGGIPIGSVLVKGGQIIGRGHNKRVQEENPILRAEIDCLRNAGRIGGYGDAVLYSTLMPCYLCAGAVVQFGIKAGIAGEAENLWERGSSWNRTQSRADIASIGELARCTRISAQDGQRPSRPPVRLNIPMGQVPP